MKRFENNLLELIPTREKCIEHYLTEVVTTISNNLVKYNNADYYERRGGGFTHQEYCTMGKYIKELFEKKGYYASFYSYSENNRDYSYRLTVR